MFDLRYHAASLVAVFFALILGILIGVGLSSRGDVSNPERTRFQEQIAESEIDKVQLRRERAALADRLAVEDAYVDATWQLVMADRLRGRRVGLVFVGPVDGAIRTKVTEALEQAGADPVVPLRSLQVPVDVAAIDGVLASRPAFARFVGDEQLDELGGALGRQLAAGGETPLWAALSAELVAERSGPLQQALDGIVLVRTAEPQQGETGRFLAGFYEGLSASGVPVVGTEASNATVSSVPALSRAGLTIVDDIDLQVGQVALAVLLAGEGSAGRHYGVKEGADSVLPAPIDPVPPAAGG